MRPGNSLEIADILRTAKAHGWSFSFSLSGKAGETPYRTEVIRIDPDLQFVAFGSEVNTLSARLSKGLRFKAQNAGISIQFESQIMLAPKNQGECLVRLPDQLLYAQKRQAVRVNFVNLQEIPVTLFTGNGEHINGTVEDISATGVKARFPGIHFHMLFLDGVYVDDGAGHFGFHANKAPTPEQLTEVLHTISQRVAGFLERRGLLERDEENSYITLDGLDEDPMQELHSHSVTYRNLLPGKVVGKIVA